MKKPMTEKQRAVIEAHKWKPGQPGNPRGINGYNTARKAFEQYLEKAMLSEVEVNLGHRGQRKVQKMLLVEALLRVFIRSSLKGHFPFAKELLERVAGKVPQKQEVSGPDGSPISIEEADAARDKIARRIAGVAARSGTGKDASESD